MKKVDMEKVISKVVERAKEIIRKIQIKISNIAFFIDEIIGNIVFFIMFIFELLKVVGMFVIPVGIVVFLIYKGILSIDGIANIVISILKVIGAFIGIKFIIKWLKQDVEVSKYENEEFMGVVYEGKRWKYYLGKIIEFIIGIIGTLIFIIFILSKI